MLAHEFTYRFIFTGNHSPLLFVYESTSLEVARKLIPGLDNHLSGRYNLRSLMSVGIGTLARYSVMMLRSRWDGQESSDDNNR
jgi:hypothetical protein